MTRACIAVVFLAFAALSTACWSQQDIAISTVDTDVDSDSDSDSDPDIDSDADTDSDSDSDADIDSDTDIDSDSDVDTDEDTDTESHTDSSSDSCACPPGWTGTACDICVRYVGSTSTDGGDGLLWSDSLDSVQDGLDAAQDAVFSDDDVDTCQVWVQEGIYVVFDGFPTTTIQLREGIELYGGFAGGECALDERDFANNWTILDGENQTYNVVTGADNARIDGFFVTGGMAAGSDFNRKAK